MAPAVLTPDKNWREAKEATVQITGGATHHNVPVNRIDATPALMIVKEQQLRSGIVLFNENTPQDNADPIDTQNFANLELIEVPKSEKVFPVYLIENAGWPCGKIVVWR